MKSQIQSQVFVYLLALVVVGVIALIGFQSINSILQKKAMIEMATFKKDFANAVHDNSNWNEVNNIKFRLPNQAMAICFYDEKATNPGSLKYQEEIIKGLSGNNNVFIIKKEKPISADSVEAFHVDKLRLNQKYLCIDAPSGIAIIRMTGLGVQGTRIS